MEACHAGGYPAAEWQELGTSVRVIFYPHSATMLGLEEKKETSTIEDLIPRQMEILNIIETKDGLSFRQIMEKLSFSISERSLKYDLSKLRFLGLITPKGKGRAIVWLRVK